jgi:HAD superfamily hydrolase (TIGR01490 family)
MNLALFDFDGTITASDTWTPFMRLAVRPSRIRLAAVVFSPLFVGYKLGAVSSSQARRAAVRVGFAGEPASVVHEHGARYASTVLPGTLQSRALERLEWHRLQGDQIVVVSASLDAYLLPWSVERRFECICTTLEERGGRLTGRYVDGDCTGAEKVRRIRARFDLATFPVVYAYGDSGEDREMLSLAHRKFYRWQEIASWDEVTSFEHPPEGGRGATPGDTS